MMGALPDNYKHGLYKAVEAQAQMLKERGQPAEAVAIEQLAVGLVRKLYGEAHENTAESLTTLAWLTNYAGNPVEGEAVARQAVAVRRKIHPADHWQIPASEFTVGESLLKQKRYPEAETLFLGVFADLQKHGPASNELLYSFWRDRLKYTATFLTEIYEATGQPGKGVEWKKQIAIFSAPDVAAPLPVKL